MNAKLGFEETEFQIYDDDDTELQLLMKELGI